jgi:HSP20 family protein
MLPVKSTLLPTVSRFFDDDWNTLFDWKNRNFSNTATALPSVNIRENNNEYRVEMAAPGMKKDDFHIEVNNNLLTIRSEVKREHEEKERETYISKEFSYQSFQRSFNLNNSVVDVARIEATYRDGILYIVLPKKEEAKPKPIRTIEIS